MKADRSAGTNAIPNSLREEKAKGLNAACFISPERRNRMQETEERMRSPPCRSPANRGMFPGAKRMKECES